MFCISLFAHCTTVTLRPGIEAVVTDSVTNTCLSAVQIESPGGVVYGLSDTQGRFAIPPVTQRRISWPGDEPGKAGPDGRVVLLKKNGYFIDTIDVNVYGAQHTGSVVHTDTIRLKPMPI
ncbi:hypothetical protein DXN05_14780 [Deminuibacter soli]|uniref:Carboxypeptidase regulatory-like domain-containing protein n=1 Tax=Deminuibacter soli TaxID=2291815 RepID=A0A3E1NH64_9BACT|nr:hypothetical protein DXN05_14780 [Deminuibacter soli]